MEQDLIGLVEMAQSGDIKSLSQIIELFNPILMKQKSMIHPNDQDDLLQSLRETLVEKILDYDLTHSPNFTEFHFLLDKQKGESAHD